MINDKEFNEIKAKVEVCHEALVKLNAVEDEFNERFKFLTDKRTEILKKQGNCVNSIMKYKLCNVIAGIKNPDEIPLEDLSGYKFTYRHKDLFYKREWDKIDDNIFKAIQDKHLDKIPEDLLNELNEYRKELDKLDMEFNKMFVEKLTLKFKKQLFEIFIRHQKEVMYVNESKVNNEEHHAKQEMDRWIDNAWDPMVLLKMTNSGMSPERIAENSVLAVSNYEKCKKNSETAKQYSRCINSYDE